MLEFTYHAPKINPGALIHGRIEAAEMAAAAVILAASQDEVPVDTGELRASGRIEHSPTGAMIIYDRVGNDGSFPVAAYIHENEDIHHPNGGHAHYLSDPMRITAPSALLAAGEELEF